MSGALLRQGSLVLNVVLAVLLAVVALHNPKPMPAGRETNRERAPHEAPILILQAAPPRYADASSAAARRRWVVDRLRTAGFSNQSLARFVLSDLDESWQRRFEEASEKKGWDANAKAALQLEIDMSRDAEMRAALGEKDFQQWDHENMLRDANGGNVPLTEAETDAAYGFWKKLQQAEAALKLAKIKGEMDDTDASAVWDKAYADFNQQLKSLLGDERYAKARQSDQATSADSLRREMAKAQPNEFQFQELLSAQQQWNERRAELDKQFRDDEGSAAYADQIRALDQARDQEYQRVLGAGVFDALQKQQDASYSMMKKYEKIWGLDTDKIDHVYGTIKYYEESVEEYQARNRALQADGQNVNAESVNQNLRQFADQTRQALKSYLGQERFDKMQRNGVFRLDQPQLPGGKPF